MELALNLRDAKRHVLRVYDAMDTCADADLQSVMDSYYRSDCLWRGFHPFGLLEGSESVAKAFWLPFRTALSSLQRRMDVLMAGINASGNDEGLWVVSMGHLMGLFDRPWLGIKPTKKLTFLRYCAFHRLEAGEITEEALYFDIPHVMVQAGLQPFPKQKGAHLIQPGPRTHDGVMLEAQPGEEGVRTLKLIEAMIADISQWQSGLPLREELSRTWRDDMLWWGPAGIGSTYTIPRYCQQHAGPFRAALSERSPTRHLCRLAEGHYGGFFGWPNFTATLTGPLMGFPATGKTAPFRVIDIYRREGDRLCENWIFIDLLHFWHEQGIDLLGKATGQKRGICDAN